MENSNSIPNEDEDKPSGNGRRGPGWRCVAAGSMAALAGVAIALLPGTANASPQPTSAPRAADADCGYYFDGITPTWGNCSNHEQAIDIHVYAQGHQGDINRCVKPGPTNLTRQTFPTGFPIFVTLVGDRCSPAYPPAN